MVIRIISILLLSISLCNAQKIDFLAQRRTDFSAGYQAVITKCLNTSGCQLPSYTQQIAQNVLYNSLPSGIDVFYCIATDGNLIFASINWITPASFTATQVNAPTFVKNQGVYGNGTSSYLNTNWTPATNGINYVQNNSSIFCYVVNNSVGNNSMVSMGSVGASSIDIILPRNVSNLIDYRINSSSATSDTQLVTKTDGFKMVYRVNSTQVSLDLDGVFVVTASRTSNGRPTTPIFVEALNNSGVAGFFSTRGVGVVGGGSALGSNRAVLYNAYMTYLASINIWGNTVLNFGQTGVTFNN